MTLQTFQTFQTFPNVPKHSEEDGTFGTWRGAILAPAKRSSDFFLRGTFGLERLDGFRRRPCANSQTFRNVPNPTAQVGFNSKRLA